jgi:hypothetical protein
MMAEITQSLLCTDSKDRHPEQRHGEIKRPRQIGPHPAGRAAERIGAARQVNDRDINIRNRQDALQRSIGSGDKTQPVHVRFHDGAA